MKRSFLMSALVLALAAGVAGCGGGGGSGEPAKDGDSAKKDDAAPADTGDPATDLQAVSDGVTKDVDAIFQPIRDVDAIIQSVIDLPKDLKAAKSKVDSKKVMAELKKIFSGGDPALDALKLEDDAKAKVQDRIDKLKALKKSIDDLPQAVQDLPGKLTDAVTKGGKIAVTSIGKLQAKIKLPFTSGDDKKKATDDMAKIQKVMDDFKAKVDGWKKEITDIPVKAKEIPGKLAKAWGK